MTRQPSPDFGAVLRLLRENAGLTQEELAQAARLSARAISDLERGVNRTARQATAELLATPLGLVGAMRDTFVAAARGLVPATGVLAVSNYADAAGILAEALDIYRDLGDRQGEANTLLCLGIMQYLTDYHQGAATNLEQSPGIFHCLGFRVGEQVGRRLFSAAAEVAQLPAGPRTTAAGSDSRSDT